MDLKDAVSSVYANAAEAHAAFHAGHRDISENYLKSIQVQVEQYFGERKPTSAEVAEQVTSETSVDEQTETPEEVPGAQVRPAAAESSVETKDLPAAPGSEKQQTVVEKAAAGRSVGTGAVEPTPPQ